MKVFGITAFFLGIASLALLVIRRGRKLPYTTPDYVAMFVGIAGSIMGLAIIFLRFK